MHSALSTKCRQLGNYAFRVCSKHTSMLRKRGLAGGRCGASAKSAKHGDLTMLRPKSSTGGLLLHSLRAEDELGEVKHRVKAAGDLKPSDVERGSG